MTEEFLKRVQTANETAINAYKAEYNRNKKYAEMYENLVLSFIEIFNYKTGFFNLNSLNRDLSEIIGNPSGINCSLNKKDKTASIHLYYKRDGETSILLGLPDFITNDLMNEEIVNDLLSENDISVTFKGISENYDDLDQYIITFDASLIISTRESLLEERGKARKKVLR